MGDKLLLGRSAKLDLLLASKSYRFLRSDLGFFFRFLPLVFFPFFYFVRRITIFSIDYFEYLTYCLIYRKIFKF